MAIKNNTFNGRIQHKHDIEANWKLAENFIPLIGEIIVYDIDENYNYERIKIGDGRTLVNNLPFYYEHEKAAILDKIDSKAQVQIVTWGEND